MRYYLIICILLISIDLTSGSEPAIQETLGWSHINKDNPLPQNYHLFKHRFLGLEKTQSTIPAANFRRQNDYTMLYVAGGILVATSTFIFINGYNSKEGYFSSSNTGIIIGGSLSSILFITKYYVDQNKFRRKR